MPEAPRTKHGARKLKPSRLDRYPAEARDWLAASYPMLTLDELLAGLEEKFKIREKRSTLADWLSTRVAREREAQLEAERFADALAGAVLNQAEIKGPADRLEAMKQKLSTEFFRAIRKAEINPIEASRERREWERLELNRERVRYEKERLELEKHKLERMTAGGQKLRDEIAAGKVKDPKALVAKLDSLFARSTEPQGDPERSRRVGRS